MTKSIKFLAAAAFALTSTIGLAADRDRQSFTQDGETYVYTKIVKTNQTIIEGRRFPGGSAFHLIVRGDRVSGVSNGQPVSFKLAEAAGAATEFAAN